MMNNVMGIINISEIEEGIRELTYHRPVATIPIAGRYRIIDFTLSNMVNSGIESVSIFTQGKSRSLMEHLGTGKDWDLNRKIGGLFVLNPITDLYNAEMMRGDIKTFKDNLDHIEKSKHEYVLAMKSYMICNIDYEEVIAFHKESKADVTVVYKKIESKEENERFLYCNTLNKNKEGKIISFGTNLGEDGPTNISMEMYIMKKSIFIEAIKKCISTGSCYFMKDAIYNHMKNLNVNGYEFNGYVSCINSIENYYKTSMDLLNVEICQELFYNHGYIYTKVKDEPPTKYEESALVKNSFIANGCIIEGRVENSIIGRGVKIKKGVVVKDSIIMQKSIIEESTALKHVILDKNVHISKGKILCGDEKQPLVLKKNLQV